MFHWNDADLKRATELISAIPTEQYRREDLLFAIDQAYSERLGLPRRIDQKWFAN